MILIDYHDPQYTSYRQIVDLDVVDKLERRGNLLGGVFVKTDGSGKTKDTIVMGVDFHLNLPFQ